MRPYQHLLEATVGRDDQRAREHGGLLHVPSAPRVLYKHRKPDVHLFDELREPLPGEAVEVDADHQQPLLAHLRLQAIELRNLLAARRAPLRPFEGRRASFGREQLVAALRIIQSGDIEPSRMVGSWAGAMGQTQFIPTVFLQYAEDGNGDGKRDLWDTRSDVFNSTANYLSNKGWQQDAPCFDEVKLPDGFDYSLADISIEKPVRDWAAMSVTRVNGNSLTGREGVNKDAPAAILLPGGHKGPAFIAYPNFKAVLAYNNAISYALAICQLSKKFDGGASFEVSWPRGEVLILSRADRFELQTLLDKQGFDVGEPDGVLGKKSREAIRAYQKKIAVPADGLATMSLLYSLRQSN